MGAVALSAAINTLSQIGMNNIEIYERSLTYYALNELKKIPQIQLYGKTEKGADQVGIIPFNIEGIPHQITARALSLEAGISVRNGCFCAQPYIQKLLSIPPKEVEKYAEDPNMDRQGMVRISFGLYNTYEEIDILVKSLQYIIQNRSSMIEKYKSSPMLF